MCIKFFVGGVALSLMMRGEEHIFVLVGGGFRSLLSGVSSAKIDKGKSIELLDLWIFGFWDLLKLNFLRVRSIQTMYVGTPAA
jgi:hypothetical protein